MEQHHVAGTGVTAASRPAPDELDGDARSAVLALHREALSVSRRVRRTLVRATRVTRTRDTLVEEDLIRDRVVVERVPVGRVVEAVPPIRQVGDVTIVPVVEEEAVVVRRLILKEEVHLRRVRDIEHHVETVSLREQDVVVTRTPIED